MLGNKRRSVVSGRLNFPVKKTRSLPAWIDKDPVLEGLSGIQETMPKRRFVDLGNVPVPRPTGPRADKKQQNKKIEMSRWVGSTYVTLDNQVMSRLEEASSPDPAAIYYAVNQDYQYPDIVIPPDDVSKVGANMWSAPIGLRVMQQHFGSRAGTMVGPKACVNGYAIGTDGASLVAGTSSGAAWSNGVLMPASDVYTMSAMVNDLAGQTTISDPLRQMGGLNTGSMFFNQIGFQWCPIVPNFIDKNDYNKLSEYKYIRFLKFGMKITIDGDSFHRSKKNNLMTSYQYAQPVRNSFVGAATGHEYNYYSGNGSTFIGEASVDKFPTTVGSTTENFFRAGPKASCVQPYGAYEYMIIGPEKLQQLDLPALMGYSNKQGAATDGLGCVHVWDTLREHGIPVHKAKKNVIDISWKPYTVSLVEDPVAITTVVGLDSKQAGPYSPSVELSSLARQSANSVTPYKFVTSDTTCLTSLRNMNYVNGYPYAHIGPVVLIRFACDPGVSSQAHKLNNTTTSGITTFTVVNPMCATVPIHVKCWSKYEAYGEDYDTFQVSTGDLWKVPTLPTVYPLEQALPNTIDPTNVG